MRFRNRLLFQGVTLQESGIPTQRSQRFQPNFQSNFEKIYQYLAYMYCKILLDKYLNLLRLVNDRFCRYNKGIPGESVIPTPLRLQESPRIRNRIFGNRTKPTAKELLWSEVLILYPRMFRGGLALFTLNTLNKKILFK